MTTIIDITQDRHLFKAWFKHRNDWRAWFVFMRALFALPIVTEEDLAIFRACTGRDNPPGILAREAWLCIGRRGGKSFVLALIAVYVAVCIDHRKYLAPGERATIPIIARDRDQARIIFRYITALLAVPMLAKLVERQTRSSFDLSNSVTIEVHTASFKSPRGLAVCCALLDEIPFWPTTDDAADPDVDVIAALRPAMAQFPNAMLLCASSPYARRGALWEAHRKHFGKDNDPVLVWQAPTQTMNPTIPQRVIDEAFERDPADAEAEYFAQFRSDIEGNRDAVDACVDVGTYERPPSPGLKYVAFTDPSGGSSDSFTVAHKDADTLFLDAIREVRPPFSPEAVISEYASLLKSYRITKVTGDRYAGEFPRELFRKFNITYQLADRPKSDLYRDTLPLINSRRVALLDHNKMVSQFVGLERRTARSGRDSIDHVPGAHDDIANAVAGSLLAAQTKTSNIYFGPVSTVAGVPGGRIDFRTGRHFPREAVNPLGPDQNGCIPGKGLDPDAALFNAQNGIMRPT